MRSTFRTSWLVTAVAPGRDAEGGHARRGRLLAVLASAVAVLGAGALLAGGAAGGGAVLDARAAFPAAGSWGRAIEVPGLGRLNKGGHARATAVSCPSAGNCAVGGWYRGRHGQQGFVADERHGRWRRAIEVPGLGALNKRGRAQVNSLSCGSAGSCVAGGFYTDSQDVPHGFVADERHGVWSRAIQVPGLAALNTQARIGEGAYVTSVSCGAAGRCAAGGYYAGRHGQQGFVADERHGRWRRAIEVPGLGALNTGGIAVVTSVSCAPAGGCAAGGNYFDRRSNGQGFVVVERDGVWGRAIEVPGLAALNKSGYAVVNSVSCASAGSCAAGGLYTYNNPYQEGFVADERTGVWGTAIKVPGLGAALNSVVSSVSCPSPGNCAAGGPSSAHGSSLGFVVSETNGVWGTAIEVPGLAALNKDGANILSVSCGSAGNCAAGGWYLDRHGFEGFVVSETNGVWGTAIEVPGLGALNKGGGAKVYSVSCAPAGGCAAGGSYTDRLFHFQAFVVSQT
jgi:hypothetical protein